MRLTEDGCLLVDSDGQTTIEGFYAAGDITPGIQLVSVAVGKGAIAGVACATSLRGQRGAPSSPPDFGGVTKMSQSSAIGFGHLVCVGIG